MFAVLAFVLAHPQDSAVKAKLTPKIPLDRESLRWSPKGAAVTLKPERRGLAGTINLGPKGAPTISVLLQKTEGAAHYDQLWIDLNGNQKTEESEVVSATPAERTGKWWSSFPQVIVQIKVDGTKTRPYPLTLWYVEDPLEPNATPTLRWSRRGWHEGQVTVDGKPAYVLITEMNMDGVFDQRDSWFLASDRAGLLAAMSRSLEDHTWLDGKAYRMTQLDPHGMGISFASFDPGFTEEQEKNQRDTLLPDKEAERAEKPVPFLHDYQKAMSQAAKEEKRVLVDFEATWCGPCKTMDQLVYTAKDVVEAAAEIVAVKVDGDVHRDLAKKYEIGAYPTMILLDADGKEIRRAVGYRSVAQMVEFLKP